MKKIGLGQMIGILANAAVVAGIVFLALQLEQSNRLLQAQARADQLAARTAPTTLILGNVNLGPMAYKVSAGQPISAEEEYYFRQVAIYTFIQWEWQYGEYRAGALKREDLPAEGWKDIVGRSPVLWRSAWQVYRSTAVRIPEFVQFMSENVFGE
jgi:hypothetical protein